MSNVEARAERAKRLRRNNDFQEFLEETRSDLARVFLDVNSTLDEREEAHAMLRALSKLEGTLDAAETAQILADKE